MYITALKLLFAQRLPRASFRSQVYIWLDKKSIFFSSLAKWLSVQLTTKWFWVQVQLQSLNLQISASSKEFLDIQVTIECGFTLKRVCVMASTIKKSIFFKFKMRKKQYSCCKITYFFTKFITSNCHYSIPFSFQSQELMNWPSKYRISGCQGTF